MCTRWFHARVGGWWGLPKRLISRLHVSVVNPPRLSRESGLLPFLRLPSPPHHPVTPSSPPPQMGPPFISPQNTNNSHWRIPKRLVLVPFGQPRLNGVMMQEVDQGGEKGGYYKQTQQLLMQTTIYLVHVWLPLYCELGKTRATKDLMEL